MEDKTWPAGTEFPSTMGTVSRRELAVHGYTRFDQLVDVTQGDLLRIHGVGPKAIRILSAELDARGLAFKPDPGSSRRRGR